MQFTKRAPLASALLVQLTAFYSAASAAGAQSAVTTPPIDKEVIYKLLDYLSNAATQVFGAQFVLSIVAAAVGWYWFNKVRSSHREVPNQVVNGAKNLIVVVRIPNSVISGRGFPALKAVDDDGPRHWKVFSRWHIDIDSDLRWGPLSRLNLESARLASRLNTLHRAWIPLSSRAAFLVGCVVHLFGWVLVGMGGNERFLDFLMAANFLVLLAPAGFLWVISTVWTSEQSDLELLKRRLDESKRTARDAGQIDTIFADLAE